MPMGLAALQSGFERSFDFAQDDGKTEKWWGKVGMSERGQAERSSTAASEHL